MSGCVASGLQLLCCRRGGRVEIVSHAAIRIASPCVQERMDFPAPLILPGGERDSRGGTDRRVDVKVSQLDALSRELVDVRRLDQRITKAARIGEAHVINEDDNDVRLGSLGVQHHSCEQTDRN